MLTSVFVTFVLIFSVTSARVRIYNTENEETVEKFDCIYYLHDGEEVSYCRRPGGIYQLDRNRDDCDNQGEKKLFRDLLDQQIDPSNVLRWSSSVEMADVYASVFYDRSFIDDDDARFVCNCTRAGTFGKYCAYQLTHNATTFGEAVKAQFEQKKKDQDSSWNTQRYGKILCYETLPCHSGPLCLDWREICDGVQRCSNGIDEENRDKLEFNECENEEFRCTNGMCIAEEFWLDGDYDCMDWSDEYFSNMGQFCSFGPNAMVCDERICPDNSYSCGDGQCVAWMTRMAFQRFAQALDDCFSKRNLNYMCEASPRGPAWTLESGLCWPDRDYDDPRYSPWNMMNASNLTYEEKCQYLFRCVLSQGFERDCPCNHLNCTQLMMSVCSIPDRLVIYPPEGLINPNVLFFYNYSQSMEKPSFQSFVLYNGIRCRGYYFHTKKWITQRLHSDLSIHPRNNHPLCWSGNSNHGYQDFLSPFQNDAFCWNESLTFNGRPYAVKTDMCHYAGECISQYRIRDGYTDCWGGEDERRALEKNYCTGNVGRHRFQCFNDQRKCLPLFRLGTGTADCSNSYDESWNGTGGSLRHQILCFKEQTSDCHRVKDYIQQSSSRNSSNDTSLISSQPQGSNYSMRFPFRSYCNSFWDMDDHADEAPSSCQHWICASDQYQCRTGQCIDVKWVCDGEWDCSDASDEEGIVLNEEWSIHNSQLSNLTDRFKLCRTRHFRAPFSKICNTSFEFGCYLSRVSNPLDFQSNRPCINLTQIGDGVEDCHNAYDEKNTFATNSYVREMWGFHLRCGSQGVSYSKACDKFIFSYNCNDILCSTHRDKNLSCSDSKDFICPDDNNCMKNARCNEKFDCSNGEDEYWCPLGSYGNQIEYRFDKVQSFAHRTIEYNSLMSYPPEDMGESNQEQVSKAISNLRNDSLLKAYSYQCNRGVAVLQMNQTQCLCPPAYYGRWCQFYSDRISIIAYLEQKTDLKRIANMTLKIQANLLFNNAIIDHHELLIIPRIEKVKHKFYLLYSRSVEMLAHKRGRYFNRTDVITNHPYSVHFDVFALEKNNTLEELGSWHYPIYFDYLPAFRLAIVLKFPSWFRNATLDPCRQNSCNENSTCLPIFNQNNSNYCSCKTGYYGRSCSMYEPRCDTYCSANAFCRPVNSDLKAKPFCICPLGHFGPRCNLKYDGCNLNPCLNNGTCFPSYDRSGEEPVMCNCSSRFYGNQCENEKASVRVNLNMTKSLSARAAVLQLYNIITPVVFLAIQHQKVYSGLPSTISYYGSNINAPVFGVLKVYEDFSHPQYFIVYLLKQSVINITSSPQHCPHSSSLLSSEIDPPVPVVFQYHQICRNDTQRFCFYDENYLCVCQPNHYRVECFVHNTTLDQCGACLAGGKCLQNNPKDPNNFVCFCPSCHQGDRCEFSLQAFGFTLDSLLINFSKAVKIIYVVLASVIFIIGLFNNICSFFTFKRPTPRKFGVGNYLFIVTCLNQIALFCLLFKFIRITVGIAGAGECRAISYLFSVFTRSTYWLTSWISVDRLLLILFPTSSSLKNPRLAIGISLTTLLVLFAMHVHEIIYYTTIQHSRTDSRICVTNFATGLVSSYNRISTLIHYLVPFFIQVASITFLIVLAARSRVKTVGQKMKFGQVLKNQFRTQKELYVMPTIIVFSALPQAILTFSFACTQLIDWQRHALLATYLLSSAPQVLGFLIFVLPSTTYKKEFGQTFLGGKHFK